MLEFDCMLETYPNFKECTFQTFDDTKSGKQLARLISYHEGIENELQELNKKGAGIFFSVNAMEKGKRDKASVSKVNARVCEIDGLDKELQLKLIEVAPVKPSLYIESKNSFHMYRFAKDGTIENWNKICRGLRNFFDGDRAVVDISRVLRVPGFNHMKDCNDPYMCGIKGGDAKLHTEEEMLCAYTDTESYTEKKEKMIIKENQIKKELGDSDFDYFRDRVRAMNTKEMLSKISGTSMVSYEDITFKKNTNGTEQIIVNGKSTGSRLDRNGKIGSTSNGGPNRTNRVFRYGRVDGKELFQRIKKEYPMMIPEKKKEQNEKKEVKIDTQEYKEFDMGGITPFTRGLDSLDKKFGRFDYNNFILAMGESGSGKTEFTFFQARKNADRGIKVCYLGLEMTKKNMIARICMKRAGVSKEQRDNKTFTDYQRKLMIDKYNELRDYKNLCIEHIENPDIKTIIDIIKERKSEGYELFYIDNLGFITGEDKEIDLTRECSRQLKELTNSEKISIVLIHHFNKGGTQDRGRPRGLASIRSSGKLENDADYIFQVWRDFENNNGDTQILLQKDRIRGEPSDIYIKFDKGDYLDNLDNIINQTNITNNTNLDFKPF